MRLACVALAWLVAMADAKPRREPAILEIAGVAREDVRVFVDARAVTAIDVNAGGDVEVTLPASGARRLRIVYVEKDREQSHEVLVVLQPGVRLRAMPHWGIRIVAQAEGTRCGTVRGGRGDWFLCDGHATLPRRDRFVLACGAPAAMASENYFYLDRRDADSVVSESFLPTAPGLYRATYANGKIAVAYERRDCSGAHDLTE